MQPAKFALPALVLALSTAGPAMIESFGVAPLPGRPILRRSAIRLHWSPIDLSVLLAEEAADATQRAVATAATSGGMDNPLEGMMGYPLQSMSLSSLSSMGDGEGSGAMGILKNVGIGVGVFFLFMIGLSVVFTNFIVPQAAKELEAQARAIDSDLWDSYQQQLGPNETIADRPDLMQELGNKVQQMKMQKFEAMQKEAEAADEDLSASYVDADDEKK